MKINTNGKSCGKTCTEYVMRCAIVCRRIVAATEVAANAISHARLKGVSCLYVIWYLFQVGKFLVLCDEMCACVMRIAAFKSFLIIDPFVDKRFADADLRVEKINKTARNDFVTMRFGQIVVDKLFRKENKWYYNRQSLLEKRNVIGSRLHRINARVTFPYIDQFCRENSMDLIAGD